MDKEQIDKEQLDKEQRHWLYWAVYYVERMTGLQLKLSERERLKQLIVEVFKNNKQTKSGSSRAVPHTEAGGRFLLEFYGIDETRPEYLRQIFDLDMNDRPSEAVKEYFKMKQDEMFLI